MKRARTILVAMTLGIGLLVMDGPAAAAATVASPATGSLPDAVTAPDQQPAPVPDPPAPTPATDQSAGAEIGSVSQVAAAAAEQHSAAALERTTVGRHASPAAKSAAIWKTRGEPDRLIIIRQGSIDSVANGRLERHIVRPVSIITLNTLAYYVPSSWLSFDGTVAKLSAAVVLTTGVNLRIGPSVTQLLLTGGPTAPDAATLFVGAGALTLRGVKVASADPVTGAPMSDTPGRPFMSVATGGRLDVIDSSVTGLGATSGATVGQKIYPAIVFGLGSHGSVVRSTLSGNTVGLTLQKSDGVLLQDVTVSNSAADGIVLVGDTDTAMSGVMAEGNGLNGVAVSGPSSPRAINGITTHANHDFGVSVAGQAKPQLSAITASADGSGGIEINHSTDVDVTGLTATDEPVAVYTHVSSARVALERLNISGGRRGVVIEKTTNGLTLTDSTVHGTELGVSLGGHQMQLTDVDVVDSDTAAVIERGAANVSVERLTINGGDFGLIANPGTTGVVVRNLAADSVSTTAIRALSPGEQIVGGRIDGSSTGIDVQAATTLSGITILGTGTGVRARTPMSIRAAQVDVTAVSVGINIADGTPFVLADSRVHAIQSIRGTAAEQGINDLSLPALSVLGVIGVPLILLAVVLEVFAVLRQRRVRPPRDSAAALRNTLPPSPVRAPDDLSGVLASTATRERV